MTWVRLTMLTALALVALTAPATAFDLTGTWSGTRKCLDVSQGIKAKRADSVTFHVTQTGNAIGILADVTGGDTTTFAGFANFSALKPDKGEFAMLHCGSNDIVGDGPAYDATSRMQATTKPGKVKAKIVGTTIFSDPGTAPPLVGTCKWSLTRTDVTDPSVATTCPGGDLVAGTPQLNPSAPICAQTFTVGVDVVNAGPVTTTGSGVVSLLDERKSDGSAQGSTLGGFPVLAPGQIFRVNLPLTISTWYNETHRITVIVDPSGALPDRDTTNNQRVVEYVLQKGACP